MQVKEPDFSGQQQCESQSEDIFNDGRDKGKQQSVGNDLRIILVGREDGPEVIEADKFKAGLVGRPVSKGIADTDHARKEEQYGIDHESACHKVPGVYLVFFHLGFFLIRASL